MLIDIAASLEFRDWYTPFRWVGLASGYISRDGAAGEEPDRDGLGGDLRGDDPATSLVKRF